MQKREFQGAILEKSSQPLIVDTVTLPEQLQAGGYLILRVDMSSEVLS